MPKLTTKALVAELEQRIARTRQSYFTTNETRNDAHAPAAIRQNAKIHCTQLAGAEKALLSMLDWARTWEA